ncbi:MspA family porin [Nocardia sp. NBC_01009]|uniref:MspA family porin n=1 Tax=Nocardia sp. NBC_01009 TaxID=2975996 RepID=UPI0038657148|nr:MspA family porin [Nocardia sp. NBC_01009]
MRPRFVVIATAVVAAVLALVLWQGAEPSQAQPPGADVSGAGIHLKTSVDNVKVDPPGDRMPNFLMTFAHAAQLSGDYSLTVEGNGITSGQAVAGFLLGCAISLSNGFTVGIDPNQGLLASISPDFGQSDLDFGQADPDFGQSDLDFGQSDVAANLSGVTLTPGPTTPSAPTTSRSAAPISRSAAPISRSAAPISRSAAPISRSAAPISRSAASTSESAATTSPNASTSPSSASLGPTVGGALGLTEVLEATLAPGEITTVTTVTANLDDKTVFPYHFIFNNAALNVGQCASPVSAVPFVTATVSTAVGTVQTTAYGSQFTF